MAEVYTPNHARPVAVAELDPIDSRSAVFFRDATWLVGIEFSADAVPAVVGWFYLRWWNSITLPSDEPDVTKMMLLDHDQIEFVDADA